MDSFDKAGGGSPARALARSLPETFFEWLDGQTVDTDAETVPLREAAGRVLAEAVASPRDIPDRATAAEDGYAVRAADTLGASDYSPLPLRLVSGETPPVPGTAREISCGDPLPQGMDAVLPPELAEARGPLIEVAGAVPLGSGVSPKGEECEAGEQLLPAGRRLRPQDIAQLALADIGELSVRQPPLVRVILAGPYRADADGPMLASLIERDGGQVEDTVTAASPAALEGALTGPGADLILVAGATGQGTEDHAPEVLAAAGHLAFHGVAIHPGDTAGLGRVGTTPTVLLPGSPLACLFAYDLFAARLLRRAAVLGEHWPYRTCQLSLARKVASRIGRLELCRVRIADGRAEPLAIVDGRLLSTAVQADGFVLVPVQSEGYDAGMEVTVHRYDL